jgi:hypothetical protein
MSQDTNASASGERAKFEEWARGEWPEGSLEGMETKDGWYYHDDVANDFWICWRAAFRASAPVAAAPEQRNAVAARGEVDWEWCYGYPHDAAKEINLLRAALQQRPAPASYMDTKPYERLFGVAEAAPAPTAKQFSGFANSENARLNFGQAEAAAIHYPECWDTAAYPTFSDALSAVYAYFKCVTCAEQEAKAAAPVATSFLDAYEMTRLRRLMKALGQDDAFERDDEYVRGVLCTVLGIAAGKIERAAHPSAKGGAAEAKPNEEQANVGWKMANWLFGLSVSELTPDCWRATCADLSAAWHRVAPAVALPAANQLPPLPEPDHSLDCGSQPFFTDNQMREYGKACASAASRAMPAPDKFKVRQDFLDWNRAQAAPPVAVGKEYAVAEKLLALADPQPQQKEGEE